MASIIDKLLDWKGINDIGMVSMRDMANFAADKLGINPATATDAEKKKLNNYKERLKKAKKTYKTSQEARERVGVTPAKKRKAKGGKYIALIPGGPADPKLRVRQEAEDEYGSKEEKTAKKRGDNKTRKQSRAKQNIEAKSAKKDKTRKSQSSPGEAPIARQLNTKGLASSPPATGKKPITKTPDRPGADVKKKKSKSPLAKAGLKTPPRKPAKKPKDLQWGEFKRPEGDVDTFKDIKSPEKKTPAAAKRRGDNLPVPKKSIIDKDSGAKQFESEKREQPASRPKNKAENGRKKTKDSKYKYYGKKGSLLGDISRALEIKYDTDPEGSLPHEKASGGMIGQSDMSAKKTSTPKKKKMPQYYMGGGPIKKGKKYANGGRVAKYRG